MEGPGEVRGLGRYGSGDTGSPLLSGPSAAGMAGDGVGGAAGFGDRSSGVLDAEAVVAESLSDPRWGRAGEVADVSGGGEAEVKARGDSRGEAMRPGGGSESGEAGTGSIMASGR